MTSRVRGRGVEVGGTDLEVVPPKWEWIGL